MHDPMIETDNTALNGAEALLQTLIDSGVEVCFANPGTSEMQLVCAMDRIAGMRPVLGLFEGVVTGAADGYGRMADKPAATLLHLGPGFANGMANLHNAKRARTPVVNIIGEHATSHQSLDAPLSSDIAGHARLVSGWVRTATRTASLGVDAATAVAAARLGQCASLIVPADLAWSPGGVTASKQRDALPLVAPDATLQRMAEALRNGKCTALLLGGDALRERGLRAAARIAHVTGAQLLCETFPARLQRGQGRPALRRLPYLGEQARALLQPVEQLLLAGSKAPVAFFGYPDQSGTLWPSGCQLLTLAEPGMLSWASLERLARLLQAPAYEQLPQPESAAASAAPAQPTLAADAPISSRAVGQIIAQQLPAQAIISDESNSRGRDIYPQFDAAPPHDWLTLTGGAIGQGMPVAVGAAIACPGRKVINLQADGSALYTNQALWTMAREGLDICVVLFNNRRYAVLDYELQRVQATLCGDKANSLFDLSRPDIDWVQLAESMGVKGSRATTVGEFEAAFAKAMAGSGPRLIEVKL